MLTLDVPGFLVLNLEHLVLDVNGTLALDGQLLTADTHGRQRDIDAAVALTAVRMLPGTAEAEQKARYVRQLGGHQVVAVGNGANDALMLREAAVGIAVLGGEGLAAVTAREADVFVASSTAGLDLLLHPRRLVATLRR